MSLSDDELKILKSAGTESDPMVRQQAVAIVLAKQNSPDGAKARELLTAGYLAATVPSFHLIPRGDKMADEAQFARDYQHLADATTDFTDVSEQTLVAALVKAPASLAPLRMILGFTHSEMAVAMRMTDPSSKITKDRLKNFERKPPAVEKRKTLAVLAARTVEALMNRQLLSVPSLADKNFHSKLDKRDTLTGWSDVASDAGGVPYSALLYQRYVGGVWRQVQDANSEVKGDALVELPIATLFETNGIPYFHAPAGQAGAKLTAQKYGLNPGPDFALPEHSPTLVIEAKVGEDGGTVRDKAARFQQLATVAHARGLQACAVVDGKGWAERPAALTDVIIATQGRTYSLSTLDHLLELPAMKALKGQASPFGLSPEPDV